VRTANVGARRSRLIATGLVAALALLPIVAGLAGCRSGPKIQAGNLKEKRERRREWEEAQKQAIDAEMQEEKRQAEEAAEPDPAPEATPTAGEAEPAPDATPAAAEAAPTPDAPEVTAPEPAASVPPPAVPAETKAAPLPKGLARATLRGADGEPVRMLLRESMIGYYERTYLTGGGVSDKEVLRKAFLFQKGTDVVYVKVKRLDRVELLPDEEGSHTGVRLRFHFKKPKREPIEYPVEDLLGATHPIPPYLAGIGPQGAVRLHLYKPIDAKGYLPLVEIDFTPELGVEP